MEENDRFLKRKPADTCPPKELLLATVAGPTHMSLRGRCSTLPKRSKSRQGLSRRACLSNNGRRCGSLAAALQRLKFAAPRQHMQKNAQSATEQSQPTPINHDRGAASVAYAALSLLRKKGHNLLTGLSMASHARGA